MKWLRSSDPLVQLLDCERNACTALSSETKLVRSCVYAIVATGLFSEKGPDHFGKFQLSLFTMFQILSGDSWASDIVRGLYSTDSENPLRYQAAVSLFFVSYYLVAGLVLLNVVVAVLLDEVVLPSLLANHLFLFADSLAHAWHAHVYASL